MYHLRHAQHLPGDSQTLCYATGKLTGMWVSMHTSDQTAGD